MNVAARETKISSAPPTESISTENIVRQLAELLPLQGPITAFAFLNPLQGMENLPYMEAMSKVKDVFGCEPFLQETEFREKYSTGRITDEDLVEILTEELEPQEDVVIGGLIRTVDLRMSMLQHSINPGTQRELDWIIGESDALRRFRLEILHETREQMIADTKEWARGGFVSSPHASEWWSRDELTRTFQRGLQRGFAGGYQSNEVCWESACLGLLWETICLRMKSTPNNRPPMSVPVRHRDMLLSATMKDSDALVHPVLIRFCAAYLDQGFSHWKLPERESGFFASFLSLFSGGRQFAQRWLKPLTDEVNQIRSAKKTALESLNESLQLLGVEDDEKQAFLQQSMLALRGWAGMIWQTEIRPDRVYISSPDGTLIEYLAVRLLLERYALKWIAKNEVGYSGTLSRLRPLLRERVGCLEPSKTVKQRAYPILQLAQLHGWTPRSLAELSKSNWFELVESIEQFSSFERRKTFHLAFEKNLARKALDAIACRAALPLRTPEQPRMQVVTCIDTREESFRRHIEEVSPDVETFSNAGFFCIPMYYRGAGDAHFSTLCPVVVKPQHWIVEDVVHSLEDSHRQRAKARRVLGAATHGFNTGTRNSISGAFLTTLLGPLFTIPLVGRILFPRTSARMHKTAKQLVAPPPITRLRLERTEGTKAGPDDDGIGFTLSEMVNLTERSLRDIGMTDRFANLVLILGHGSNCMNNPHESAYHCGACSGSPGGANARALAAMANDPRVRRELALRGMVIPESTYFLGGLHNTATDGISFFDLELLPTSHVRSLRDAVDIFKRVAERNAHERCRRFESAPLTLTPSEALIHVTGRADDLAQTRPEYGNSTNAICFVGRRSRVRGMYLDRRAFLMSYDPMQDTDKTPILARILSAVIPVCEGINMLYTLSAIDSSGWGCGTKLPHNITSLLGVMDGASSDLRPGLPWQGCDIHEPVRLLFLIEATPLTMLRIMEENAWVGRICRNGWAQLAVLDPHSNRIKTFVKGQFENYEPRVKTLPQAGTSLECYRGHRGNMPFAMLSEVADSISNNRLEPAH